MNKTTGRRRNDCDKTFCGKRGWIRDFEFVKKKEKVFVTGSKNRVS